MITRLFCKQPQPSAIRTLSGNAFLRRGLSTHANVEEEATVTLSTIDEEPYAAAGPSTSSVGERIAPEEESDAPLTDVVWVKDIKDTLITEMCERDTLKYVAGFLIRRLACPTCLHNMQLGELVESSTEMHQDSGFIREMTFESSRLLQPCDSIIA